MNEIKKAGNIDATKMNLVISIPVATNTSNATTATMKKTNEPRIERNATVLPHSLYPKIKTFSKTLFAFASDFVLAVYRNKVQRRQKGKPQTRRIVSNKLRQTKQIGLSFQTKPSLKPPI